MIKSLKNIINITLFSVIFICGSKLNAEKIEIKNESVVVTSNTEKVDLYFNENEFYIEQNGVTQKLDQSSIEESLQNISESDLKEILESGYFTIDRDDNGNFHIEANSRLEGGGPILGIAAAWLTKFTITTACQGGILLVGAAVSVVATPIAGAAVVAGLESTITPIVETASTAAAVAVSTVAIVIPAP